MRRLTLLIAALLALCGAIGPASPSNAGKRVNPSVTFERHGMGLILPSNAEAQREVAAAQSSPFSVQRLVAQTLARDAALPSFVDLSQWDPAIGDQGYIGSCVSWAEGWYLRQWLLKHDWGQSFPAGGPAPIMLYAQQTHDPNAGSTFEGNFASLEAGIATDAQYDSDHASIPGHEPYVDPGYYQYLDNPTAADIANGRQYAISGYSPLFVYQYGQTDREAAIKAALAGGQPVVIGIAVYHEFMFYNGVGYIQPHAAGSTYYGGHALFVDGYDANGISGPNQWGRAWGDRGRWHLSWDFVNSSDLFAAYTATAVTPPSPTPTTIPTATIAPTSTSIPPEPTSTATPIVVSPTATVTPTPVHKHHRKLWPARPRWLAWPA